jgi:hypothetical protein
MSLRNERMIEAIPNSELYAILRDEYDRVTRLHEQLGPKLAGCRKKLYVAALGSILMNATGAVPEKVEALGIELQPHQQEKLTIIIGLICLYFLFEFTAMLLQKGVVITRTFVIGYELEIFQTEMFKLAEKRRSRSFVTRSRYLLFLIAAIFQVLVVYVFPLLVGFYGVAAGLFPSFIPGWIKL